ncbi:MAG TPA: dihydropteroate synthase [Acidobacteriaceae bacterium]|nr:dihydropteroate synthase [Acidobacteriaceae bacterium]
MAFARRDEFLWKLRTCALTLGPSTLIIGVLNVTPDSFSDGGLFDSTESAAAHALRMLDEGAGIIDIGGESTRPGKYASVTAEEEQDRILPVVQAVLKARPDAVLSIDTWRASTARAAVNAGAEIINDISGFNWDPEMPQTCAGLQCGLILMHTRGRPDEWRNLPQLEPDEILPLVGSGLELTLEKAFNVGIDGPRIVIDPGYGFGKAFSENFTLLARQHELQSLGLPILAGVSRKSFLGRALADLYSGNDAPVPARANATLAATTAAILNGAHIVRVHDIRPALEAAHIADAILASG